MKPEVIFKFLLKKATSLSVISVNYLSIYEEECFRGDAPSLIICSRRFVLALSIFHIQFLDWNSISFLNETLNKCLGKLEINPTQRPSTV